MPNTPVKLLLSRFEANRALVALVLVAGGCAAPTRSVAVVLDPANPDAEIQSGSAQLTPLIAPGPATSDSAPSNSATDTSHDTSALRLQEKSSEGGNDMKAMRMPGETGTAREGEEHLMGVVTGVAGASINVRLEKGTPTVVLTDKATAFERGDSQTNLSGIQNGEQIVLYGASRGGNWLARVVKLSAKLAPGSMPSNPEGIKPSVHAEKVKMPDTKNPPKVQVFTCPMHPEIRSPTPGKCPKCGMTLKEIAPK